MPAVSVSHIAKKFGAIQAVRDVSFEVQPGEIFGLLGPNGAGKTTTIRILLDLFRPDSGEVAVLGGAMSEAKKARIGYMPEERGLYQDISLERCLVYLASLKGVPEQEGRKRLEGYLERFGLAGWRKKKIKELSKGMQQKAQIISTILHQPELIIVDEPFNALDPINLQLVKDVLLELRQAGAAIIMSTHQMHQVEELCDRIVLIHDGQDMLYGNLEDIRRQFPEQAVLVRMEGELPALEGVVGVTRLNHTLKLALADQTTPLQVMQQLAAHDIALEKFEIAYPTLDEIFIRVVKKGA